MAADRAVNFAMRVNGVAEAQRSFMAVGQSARRALTDIEVAAKAQAGYEAATTRASDSAAKFGAAQATVARAVAQAKAELASGAISQEQYNVRVLETKSSLALVKAEHAASEKAVRAAASAVANATETAARHNAALQETRARYVPLAGAGQAYVKALREIRTAHTDGALSAKEMAAAIQREKAAFASEVAAIKARNQALVQASGANGAARAGFQQLGFQINDVTTQLATGTPVMQIFAQQSGQTIQAVSLLAGETSLFARIMGGPWGLAITTAVSILGYLGAAYLSAGKDAEDALSKVQFASDGVSDAQGILGRVMDLTTGKITTQSKALLALARAQLVVAEIQSRARAAQAQADINDSAKFKRSIDGGFGGGISFRKEQGPEAQVESNFRNGVIDSGQAVRQIENLNKRGKINDEDAAKLVAAYGNFGAEQENQKAFQQAKDLLDGKGNGAGLLKKGRDKKKSGPDAAEITNRFDGERAALMQRYNGLLADAADNAQDVAEFELRNVELARIRNIAEINATNEYSAARKKVLIGQVEEIADMEREAIERDKRERLLQEQLRRDETVAKVQRDILAAAEGFAASAADRRKIQLATLELERRQEKAQLEATIASEKATAAEKENARAQLASLDKVYGLRAQGVRDRTAGPAEGYLRDLRKSAETAGEQTEAAYVRGLQSLNDGLTDAIVNFRSLGDVAQSVLRQITTDLVRMGVEKYVTTPLAKMLFPDQAAAAAQGPSGAEATSAALGSVTTSAYAAANALASVAGVTRPQLDELGATASRAGEQIKGLAPSVSQFGSAIAQALSMLGGGGGGGGGLGSLLQLGASLLGGPSASTVAALTPSAAATIAANPALFASGTDRVPVGKPFWVGENGRELMELTRGGGLMVHSNQQAHRMAGNSGGGFHNTQIINIPERADPRRTAAGIARSTQGALMRSARKGLASVSS